MKDEITSHLKRFVSFRTVEGANAVKRKCLEWVDQVFFERATKVRGEKQYGEVEDCPYLFLEHPDPKLLFFAHIDVVPGNEDQFILKHEGDALIGRGTSDMKGNQLPFLMAYAETARAGMPVPPISILLTSDEETAGPTIPTLLKEGKLGNIPVAFTPDTSDRIVVEHKGVLWAELVCRGRGAHAAYPWDGFNPNYLLADALKRIEKTFPKGTKDDWQLTVTPTKLSGSVARNQIPEVATAGLDIRFPKELCTSPEEAKALVAKHLPESCTIETVLSADPLSTDPKHPMVQTVKRIAEEVTGKKVLFGREHGGTDARYFGNSGIPSFLYGARGGGMHGAEEWVSLQSLTEQYELSKRLIAYTLSDDAAP